VLGFEPSGELLVMLILGGVGRLYGAFIGPLAYLVAQTCLPSSFRILYLALACCSWWCPVRPRRILG